MKRLIRQSCMCGAVFTLKNVPISGQGMFSLCPITIRCRGTPFFTFCGLCPYCHRAVPVSIVSRLSSAISLFASTKSLQSSSNIMVLIIVVLRRAAPDPRPFPISQKIAASGVARRVVSSQSFRRSKSPLSKNRLLPHLLPSGLLDRAIWYTIAVGRCLVLGGIR